MMRTFFFAAFTLIVLACQHSEVSPIKWSQSMWQLSAVMSSILPTISQTEPISPAKQVELKLQTQQLESIAHDVDQVKLNAIQDPSLPMVTKEFKKQLHTALTEMEANQWARATHSLRQATRYCIACHTMKEGKSFAVGTGLNPQLKELSSIQKADFYAATRQFDTAIINYENGLTDIKWAQANPVAWSSAVQRLLAITVRVKNDPSLSMELISRFFDSDTYPKNLKEDAHVWRNHTKTWRTEAQQNLSAQKQIDQAVRLVDDAQKLKGEQGFVANLRASGLLHRALSTKLKQEQQLKALFYSGLAAEGLKNANFWIYPEDFYSSCKNINAHSKWGKKCVERL